MRLTIDARTQAAAENALRESRALLHAVYRAQSAFIEHADDDQVFTELLSGLLVLAECGQALILEHDGTDADAHFDTQQIRLSH